MTLLKMGAAFLGAAATALIAASPALSADADIIGLWAGGIEWGKANRIRIGDQGTLNAATGKLDLNPANFGVNNSTVRTQYSGRYANNPKLAFAIAEQDPGLNQRQSESRPLYKPEYWQLVDLNGYLHHSDPTGTYLDPQWKNLPPGVPLLGAPSAIVPGAFPNELYFIYQNRNTWRYIPTDCRPHDESLTYDVSFNGHAVGCWEGDTLVVTSKGFTDQTWLGWSGLIHSNEMEVEERFRLNADKTRVAYTRIVRDPMFLEPWDMGTVNMNRNTNAMNFLGEDFPFDNRHLLEVGGGG